MSSLSSDSISPFLSQIPQPLHDKLSVHWDAWLQACQLQELNPEPGLGLDLLVKIWACSDFVAGTSYRNPSIWFDLIDNSLLETELSLEDYQAELVALLATVPAANDVALMKAIRWFRQKHMLRIAWRDLANKAVTTETLRNLTELAEACVDQVLEFLHQDQCKQLGVPSDDQGNEQRLIVLGMGKLGGHELNYSSDIDLIFAFPEEGEVQGGRTLANSQFFIRLGQRFIRVLNDVTADGFVFRVDMRLRPYGDSGPLVMSFGGMEQYYQTQGRDWERYAMIKARVIGGDRKVGMELTDMLRPFVYRRYLDFGAFESIREMKALIDTEIRRKGNEHNIKLGKGGIREIEFIGQTYQLIRGGGESELQVRSILQVLNLLADKGYITQQAADELTDSYDYLRRLENRLQMYADAQTHVLPDDPLIQQSMMLAMGYESWPALLEATAFHRQRVHGHFSDVFALPQLDNNGSEVTSNPYITLWRDDVESTEAVALLQQQEVSDADELVRQLEIFKSAAFIQSLTGTARQRLDNLMPLLLKQVATSTNAGQVLQRVLNLITAIVRRSVYLALLIEYPVALKQLISLCAASPWIANLLTRFPILLDELLDPRALYELPNKKQLAIELDHMLAQAEDDEERQLEVLRKFKQAHVLRIAAMDVAHALNVFEVSEQLTDIAEVLLGRTYQLAWEHIVKRHGKPHCRVDGQVYLPSIAIIAYGKMGGHELGYGSDLDIVFLHDSKGEAQFTDGNRSLDNNTFFARVAQRIVHLLGAQTANGRLYEVDTRLRPDGAAGMLVSSLDAFERYQLEKAWTWEHQALIRARLVVGSPHLGEEFDRIRRSVLVRPRDAAKLKQDVVEMRHKMRATLGSGHSDQFQLKQDAGGIVDIEFITQYGILASAADHPQLIDETATRQLLLQLQQVSGLEMSQVAKLSEVYEAYRACSHQRALQEQSSTLDNGFESQRADVIEIWQNILGDDSHPNP